MFTVIHNDCLSEMAQMRSDSVDSVCTDPPYNLSFMGRTWDTHGQRYQGWCQDWASECLRILKPGGYLLAFGGTRTYHRLACGIEDAGFEIRDSIDWIYGSGFPKSLDVSKAIDKAAGAEREVIATRKKLESYGPNEVFGSGPDHGGIQEITAPATDAAKQWQGWGTALKPAHEPIVMARKPLAEKTVASNVVQHGTGGINIDGCRIGDEPRVNPPAGNKPGGGSLNMSVTGMPQDAKPVTAEGRWPANVILSHSPDCLDWICALDCPVAEMDRQSGQTVSRKQPKTERKGGRSTNLAMSTSGQTHADSGGASRFFYHAKASRRERPVADGIVHPTCKPVDLMRYLARLVTPPGGLVLDPFAGTGTTAEACALEGFDCILIEQEADYIRLISQRMSGYEREAA